MIHFASQIIVQKQQMYLGAKRTPPGKSRRALQLPEPVPDVAASQYVQGMGKQLKTAAERPPHTS
jgi:hypothetical protein